MALTARTALAHVDAVVVDVRAVPRGRKGLWGALAASVAVPGAGRALPLLDSHGLGRSPSMFDYDPALATALEA